MSIRSNFLRRCLDINAFWLMKFVRVQNCLLWAGMRSIKLIIDCLLNNMIDIYPHIWLPEYSLKSHMLAVEMHTQSASYHNCLNHSFTNTPRCRDMIWCQDPVTFSMHCLRSRSECPKPWKSMLFLQKNHLLEYIIKHPGFFALSVITFMKRWGIDVLNLVYLLRISSAYFVPMFENDTKYIHVFQN